MPYTIFIHCLADLDLEIDRIIGMKHGKMLGRPKQNKKGQTLVEYALILAFISVVAISVLIRLGDEVKLIFTTITSQLAVAGSSH